MDNDNQREMEPLLPLMDDDTLTILREKDLLINSDCLRLSDVVGQGRSKCIYIYNTARLFSCFQLDCFVVYIIIINTAFLLYMNTPCIKPYRFDNKNFLFLGYKTDTNTGQSCCV